MSSEKAMADTQPIRILPHLREPARRGLARQVAAIGFIWLKRLLRPVKQTGDAIRPGLYYLAVILLLIGVGVGFAFYVKYWQSDVQTIFQVGKDTVSLAAAGAAGVLIRYFTLLGEQSRKKPRLNLFIFELIGSVAVAATIVPAVMFLITAAQLNKIGPYPITLDGAPPLALNSLAFAMGLGSSKRLKNIMDKVVTRATSVFKSTQTRRPPTHSKKNDQTKGK